MAVHLMYRKNDTGKELCIDPVSDTDGTLTLIGWDIRMAIESKLSNES